MRALRIGDGEPATFALYVTKGLVDVAEAELRELTPGSEVLERDERFLIARMTIAEAADLGARARTVDDLRLLVAGPATIRTADEFEALCTAAAATTEAALPAADDPWSVTVSALDPPWRAKPRWTTAPILAARLHGADPAATSRNPVDLRLQVEGPAAHLSLNLWDQPLGKRAGEPAFRWHGALRSTVAASMVRIALDLAGPPPTERVGPPALYDPFCGSGTIVAEAARLGLAVFASDESAEAVDLTRERLASIVQPSNEPERAGFGAAAPPSDDLVQRVFVRDVLRGPDQRVTGRLIASNLPWGKQVEVRHRVAMFDATAILVGNRLREGGAAVLLTTHEDALAARLRRHGLTVTTRRIGLLGQVPAMVCATFPG